MMTIGETIKTAINQGLQGQDITPSSSYGMTAKKDDRELAQFLSRYAPDTQLVNTADAETCVMGDAPTLSEMDAIYGKNASSLWLVPQLTDLSEFCNVQSSLSEKHIITLARLITAEYHYLKITELMLFFRRIKTGAYGKFYGTVSPIDIMYALRQFISERNRLIDTAESKAREVEMERWAAKAVSYDEYLSKQRLLTVKECNNEDD